jgi:PhnB protein
MIKQLNPYLIFNDGKAEPAIKLYEKALGAKVENIQRYKEVPGDKSPASHKDRIVHARLHVGDHVLMVSDSHLESTPVGYNVQISLDFDDPVDMGRKFEALSAGGKVTMALQDMFWGAKFGMLQDAFGVGWMFNCQNKK